MALKTNSLFANMSHSTIDGETIPPTNNTLHIDNLYKVPTSMVIALTLCYATISLVTILGNVCVLLIVALSRRMKTVTNYYIANLATADILIGCFAIPFQFQAALLQRWVFPAFMCAFCPFIQVLSVNVSVFSLAAIALDRYQAVMNPIKAKTSNVNARWTIAIIWIFSAVMGVPYAIAFRVTMMYDPDTKELSKAFCMNIGISDDAWKVYNYILVCVQYLVPLCLITMLYAIIGLKLSGTKSPGNREGKRDDAVSKNKKKAIHMLFIVVAVFAVCWLPLQLYNIFQEILPQINEYKYINVIWFCSHWLAMSNSCYNPFIYAIYNERFNSEFKKRFGCCLYIFGAQPPEQNSTDSSYR